MKSQKPSALFQFQQSTDPLSSQALRPQLARLCLDLESLHNISDLPQLPQKIANILPICLRQSIFDYGRWIKQVSEGVERGMIEPDWVREWGLEELSDRISWAVDWLKKFEDIQRQRQEKQHREQQKEREKEREREREEMLRMEVKSSMDQEFSQQISQSYSDCQSLGVESVSVDYSACFGVEPELNHECGHNEQQIEKDDTKNQQVKKKKKKKKIEQVQEIVEEEDSNTFSFMKRKRN